MTIVGNELSKRLMPYAADYTTSLYPDGEVVHSLTMGYSPLGADPGEKVVDMAMRVFAEKTIEFRIQSGYELGMEEALERFLRDVHGGEHLIRECGSEIWSLVYPDGITSLFSMPMN